MAKNPNAGDLPLDELLKKLEQTALHGYPNPTRKGCPSEDILERFANDPLAFGAGDPTFEHITHCSPCLQFINERRKGERRANSNTR